MSTRTQSNQTSMLKVTSLGKFGINNKKVSWTLTKLESLGGSNAATYQVDCGTTVTDSDCGSYGELPRLLTVEVVMTHNWGGNPTVAISSMRTVHDHAYGRIKEIDADYIARWLFGRDYSRRPLCWIRNAARKRRAGKMEYILSGYLPEEYINQQQDLRFGLVHK